MRVGCPVQAGVSSNGLMAPPSPTNQRVGVELHPLWADLEVPPNAEVGQAKGHSEKPWVERRSCVRECALHPKVGALGVGCRPTREAGVLEGCMECANPGNSDEFSFCLEQVSFARCLSTGRIPQTLELQGVCSLEL